MIEDKRFYIHGDKEVGGAGFYCQFCDVFSDRSHFDEVHLGKNIKKYEDGLKTVKVWKKSGASISRPLNVVGLFGCNQGELG